VQHVPAKIAKQLGLCLLVFACTSVGLELALPASEQVSEIAADKETLKLAFVERNGAASARPRRLAEVLVHCDQDIDLSQTGGIGRWVGEDSILCLCLLRLDSLEVYKH
jgi:hypothetical protein